MILLYLNIIVFIINLKNRKLSFNLLKNREFLFELYKFNTLSVYIYIVNHNIFKIFMRNNINRIITLPHKVKLNIIINYKIVNYYVINFSQYDLIIKTLKYSLN